MSPSALTHASLFMATYVLGPFLAFLPSRWRAKWFSGLPIHWRAATIISGLLQFLLAPFALLLWASGEVCSLGNALGFGCGGGPTQTFLLIPLALNPVTWVMVYLIFEGFGRAFAAAMLGEAPGTAVLVVADWLYLTFKRKLWPQPPPLPDLVTLDDHRAEWQLKIASSHPKSNWVPGRLLRYAGNFYRIEACTRAPGMRPNIYTLRRQAAGVASYRVIMYSPEEAAPQQS